MSDQKTNIMTSLGFSPPPADGATRPVNLIDGSDVTKSYAPADAGDIYNTSTGTRGSFPREGDTYGLGSRAGNKLIISDSPGSAAVQLHHMSGSQVYISPDGSLAISGKGKGVIITAKGDIVITGSQDVVINSGGDISLNTTGGGDIDINSGGDVNIHAKGNFKVRTAGNIEHFSDSNMIENVGKDKSSTVAGERRDTVAGDMQLQVAGKNDVDVGKGMNTRVKEDIFTSTKKRMFNIAKESSSMDVTTGALEIRSKGNIKLQSHDGNLTLSAKNDSALNTKGNFTFSSTGNMTFNTKGKGTFAALDTIDISAGSTMGMSATGQLKVSSHNGIYTATSGKLQLVQGFGTTNTPLSIGGSDTPSTATTPADPTDPVEPVNESKIPEPQVPDANTITNEITSYIEHKDVAMNLERRSLEYYGTNSTESEDTEEKSRVASNKGAEEYYVGPEIE